jgi:nitroreductase
MDVFEAIKKKRAVRQFEDRPLPEQAVLAILDAGRRAQSSKNTQPWTFVAVRDRATLAALSRCGDYAQHLAGAALGVALVSSEEWAFDQGQAAAYMQLAATALGVGSCIASMWQSDRAKEILGVPAERHLDVVISFGYPASEAARAERRPGRGRQPLEDVVRWERW